MTLTSPTELTRAVHGIDGERLGPSQRCVRLLLQGALPSERPLAPKIEKLLTLVGPLRDSTEKRWAVSRSTFTSDPRNFCFQQRKRLPPKIERHKEVAVPEHRRIERPRIRFEWR